MYPYDENNNSTNTPETGSERPAEDGSYRIVKPDAEREACYRDASYTPQGEASFDGYYVPGGRGPKPPEPEKKPHKRGIGAAGVIAPLPRLRAAGRSLRRTYRKLQPARRGRRQRRAFHRASDPNQSRRLRLHRRSLYQRDERARHLL